MAKNKKELKNKTEKIVEMEIGKSGSQNQVCVSGRQAQRYSELAGKAGCFITVQAFTQLVENSIAIKEKEKASSKGGGELKSDDDETTTKKDSARSDSKKEKRAKKKAEAEVEKTTETIAKTPAK